MTKITRRTLIAVLIAGLNIVGCGGGEGGTQVSSTDVGVSVPQKILNWTPPLSYSDGSSLNPATDLDVYEVYVKQNGSFAAGESAMAAVGAYDPGTGLVMTTFNLTGLRPFLSDGVTYYVSVRAVAKNGLKSDFSQSATFSF